jgi:drug/metabolite transporter (DMT)-like permease
MFRVTASNNQTTPQLFGFRPVVLGTACCVVAALGYTAANICLRKLAQLGADEMWVTCVKEVVTVTVVGPWLLAQAFRGCRPVPAPRILLRLVVVGLAVQLLGNLSVQWAYGVVGIAITISAIFGVMLTASAVMGFLFLGERVSIRSIAAIALLITAIALLRLGADDVNRAIAVVQETVGGSADTRLGVAAACLAGLMFATLAVVLRHTTAAGVPVASIVFVVTGMGVLSMGSLSLWRLGWNRLVATPPEHLAWMLAAGSFNLIAFLAITKGLQLTTVVRASLLNASQVALGAIAGILLFDEPLTRWLVLGVALTIVGMMLIDLPEQEETEPAGA